MATVYLKNNTTIFLNLKSYDYLNLGRGDAKWIFGWECAMGLWNFYRIPVHVQPHLAMWPYSTLHAKNPYPMLYLSLS